MGTTSVGGPSSCQAIHFRAVRQQAEHQHGDDDEDHVCDTSLLHTDLLDLIIGCFCIQSDGYTEWTTSTADGTGGPNGHNEAGTKITTAQSLRLALRRRWGAVGTSVACRGNRNTDWGSAQA